MVYHMLQGYIYPGVTKIGNFDKTKMFRLKSFFVRFAIFKLLF